ncbi:MAG: SAM-dependent chlorinase/fluorinase [Desulfobacteraceae bacterium]|jgi:S-adenosylmethionine hydrolase
MNASGIITLTTDFGLSDPYVAMMKGVILSINPGSQIVDISHQIRAGAIIQAAGLVHETFPFFPKGTVHVAVVDPGVGSERRPMGMEAGGHFFVGPDNGIFWPIIAGQKKTRIIHLTESTYFLPSISPTFHGREVFAPVAAHLSQGVPLKRMGAELSNPVKLHVPKPREERGVLYGLITRVDNFGNLISNIHRKDLESFLQSFEPMIEVRDLTIKTLHPTYADVQEGEPLALINSSDWLEIAVNLGRATQYAGLAPEEIIGAEVKVSKSKKPS